MDLAIEFLAAYLRYVPLQYKKEDVYYRLLEPLCVDRPRLRTVNTFAGIFRCNIQDLVQRYIWLWGNWEPLQTSYLRSHIKPGDLFVDVGANIGWFTVLAGNLGAQVVSFEPLPSIFAELQANVSLNGLKPRLARAAISDHQGETPVYRASDTHSGLSTTAASRGYAFEAMAPVLPLHVALSPKEVQRVRLVKVDTEGVSLPAARGLLPMLPNTRRDFEILMELDVDADDDPAGPGEVAAMFSRAGLHAYAMNNDYGPRTYLEKMKSYEAPRCDPSSGWFTDVLFSRRDERAIRWAAP